MNDSFSFFEETAVENSFPKWKNTNTSMDGLCFHPVLHAVPSRYTPTAVNALARHMVVLGPMVQSAVRYIEVLHIAQATTTKAILKR